MVLLTLITLFLLGLIFYLSSFRFVHGNKLLALAAGRDSNVYYYAALLVFPPPSILFQGDQRNPNPS